MQHRAYVHGRLLALGLATTLALGAADAIAATHNNSNYSNRWNKATSMAKPSDANIAAIVLAANNGEIKAGREAERISKNEQVRKFAQEMIRDHGSVNKKATDLARRLELTPKENATCKGMESNAARERTHLMSLSGAGFDRAYVDNEVRTHQAVLDMIDNTLMPNAQNADLKKLLEDTRPSVESHLKMARDLQSQMGSSSTGR